MPDEPPPGVVDNDGHYEVDPALMSIYPQFATDFEVDRIVKDRLEYLYWVQRHFADQVLPPHAQDTPGGARLDEPRMGHGRAQTGGDRRPRGPVRPERLGYRTLEELVRLGEHVVVVVRSPAEELACGARSWGRPDPRQPPGPGGAARRRGAGGQRPGRHRGRRRRQPPRRPGRPGEPTRPCACGCGCSTGSWAGGCRSCSRTARCSTRPPWPCPRSCRRRCSRTGSSGSRSTVGPWWSAGPAPATPGCCCPWPGPSRRHRRAVPRGRGRGAVPRRGATGAHPPRPASGASRPRAAGPGGRRLDGAARRRRPPAGDGGDRPRADRDRHRHLLVVLRAGPRPDRRHLLHGHDHDHHRLRRHPPARRAAAAAVRRRPDAVGHRRPGHPVRADHRRADQRPAGPRPRRQHPRGLHDHVVVCGLGNIGYRIVEQLHDLGVPIVAAELHETTATCRRCAASSPGAVADIRLPETWRSCTSAGPLGGRGHLQRHRQSGDGPQHPGAQPDIRVVQRLFDPRPGRPLERAFSLGYDLPQPSALAAPAFAAAAGEHVLATIAVGWRSWPWPASGSSRAAGPRAAPWPIGEAAAGSRVLLLHLDGGHGPSWHPDGATSWPAGPSPSWSSPRPARPHPRLTEAGAATRHPAPDR